jgi:4-amino-4-deoxy-L-arabinose transferase-like glycosyltransferase
MEPLHEKPDLELVAQPINYLFDVSDRLDPFRLERRMALMLILVAAWYWRAMNAGYSSAYMDESVYVLYGRMFLARQFEAPIDQPLRWSFGWYLWPMMAAIADRIGGIIAVRELAALLGTITVAAVYGFARRVFSPVVGLASAAVFAVLAPAIYTSRIATRDSGAIAFFALGLWAFTCALQGDRKRDWLAACASFFAAFLCKYVVAFFFPFLVLLAFRKKLRPWLFFNLPLALLCAAYVAVYHNDLVALLRYGSAYGSLRAPTAQLLDIYLRNRLDFWVIAGFSCLAFLRRGSRRTVIVLWAAAVIFLVFQWQTRADYDYWKHVTYPLLFLTPLAAAGVLEAVERICPRDLNRRVMASAFAIVAVCGVLGWIGKSWNMGQFVFWPNVEPALAYMEGRLAPANRVLVDDSVFRYYFHPPLRQRQITDPFYLWYQGQMGDAAYAAAIRDGWFQYVLLDGGIGEEARRMQSAIRPMMGAGYTLLFSMPDPQLGHPIEIYGKNDLSPLAAASSLARIRITSPQSNSLVRANGILDSVEGIAYGASPNSRIHVEVFTDRWYSQPEIVPHSDGTFSAAIYLGGGGKAQCHHLIRARLYDNHGNAQATDLVYNVVRANPDGSSPRCQ